MASGLPFGSTGSDARARLDSLRSVQFLRPTAFIYLFSDFTPCFQLQRCVVSCTRPSSDTAECDTKWRTVYRRPDSSLKSVWMNEWWGAHLLFLSLTSPPHSPCIPRAPFCLLILWTSRGFWEFILRQQTNKFRLFIKGGVELSLEPRVVFNGDLLKKWRQVALSPGNEDGTCACTEPQTNAYSP